MLTKIKKTNFKNLTFYFKISGYAMWFTAGSAICIGHYDIIDDVITRKL